MRTECSMDKTQTFRDGDLYPEIRYSHIHKHSMNLMRTVLEI